MGNKKSLFGKTEKSARVMAAGLAAAVIMSAASADRADVRACKQMFMFPQFAKTAAADRSNKDNDNGDSDHDDKTEITYSFRLAELIERLFRK